MTPLNQLQELITSIFFIQPQFLGFLSGHWVFSFDQDRVYLCLSERLTLRTTHVGDLTLASATAQLPLLPWTLPLERHSWLAMAALTSSRCGLPPSLLSTKSLRLYPTSCSLATSLPSRVQFDFWTHGQDPPFIPIKFHLVRFRVLFMPVEITLDLGPDSCLPLCFMSSANLISMLSMFSSKSLMERVGSTKARTRPSRSLEIALQVVGDQSISIHWVLSFIQVPVHWAILSSSPHFSIKSTATSAGTLSNVLLIPRFTMLEHSYI